MKKSILLLLFLLVIISCKKDENDIVSPSDKYTPKIVVETYGNGKLVGFVKDKSGNPLADVTVFFGEEKTLTKSDGSYQLNTLSAGANKRIWFQKDGYASTQKLANISEELPNRIDASMFKIGKTATMTSKGGKIEDSEFSVEIEAGGFVYSDGSPVEEDIIVEATAFLTSEKEFLNAFPGQFRGTRENGTITAIESFGFIDVVLKVESGEPVQLAEGVVATIKIKAPQNAPATIPMWHYDEDKAKWIEEGIGTKKDNFYTAQVSHFTKWNWDRPYEETSKIVGRVIDSEGNPIEGASVVQKGITYKFQNSAKTNEEGKFELLTPESNESEIEAQIDFYGSTIVNYTTSPTKGQVNNIGDIIINVNVENMLLPIISTDNLYITIGMTTKIRGKYFGSQKKQGYKLLLNGAEVETTKWENELIEFIVPNGIPEKGTIQIDRDGILSRIIDYEEGDSACEIEGILYGDDNLPIIDGKYFLVLDMRSLKEIPNCIGNLNNLNTLRLSKNQLTALPESFGNLTNLSELYLDYNQLAALPESIGNLTNLSELYLYSNQLTNLPESIGNLNKLYELYLNNNQLISLPDNIGSLSNLSKFYLDNNKLTTLPTSIGNLQKMEVLVVSNNKLTTLPTSIGNLQKMEVLDVSYNQLTTLPTSIGNLQKFRALDVSYNQLTTLPTSIGNIQSLGSLNFNNNQLKAIPESIGNLDKLYYLSLKKNQLSSLPESIGDLSNLSELYLDYNKLTTLPESIKNLKNTLKKLSITGNNFSEEEKLKIYEWMPDTDIYW